MTATDLNSGEEVVLSEGIVAHAVLATIALPGIFPPQVMGDHRLIDGGTLDPVPVRPARELGGSPVVASVLSPARGQWSENRSPSLAARLPGVDMLMRLRPGQALMVFQEYMEIASRTYTETRLEIDRPEVIVRPAVWQVGLLDDPSADEMSALGERAMESMLPALREQFSLGRRAGAGPPSCPGRPLGMKPRDLRSYAGTTTARLIAGGILLLIVVGGGLVYAIYGGGALISAVAVHRTGTAARRPDRAGPGDRGRHPQAGGPWLTLPARAACWPACSAPGASQPPQAHRWWSCCMA